MPPLQVVHRDWRLKLQDPYLRRRTLLSALLVVVDAATT